MPGLGTIINTAAIVAGGLFGLLFGKITGGGTMLVIGCLALGALIGELLDLEALMERFGKWLKQKTGNAKDARF